MLTSAWGVAWGSAWGVAWAGVWGGMPDFIPIQGVIVAAVFFTIALVKVIRGVRGSDAIVWNTVGIVTLLYLFVNVAWFASGGFAN